MKKSLIPLLLLVCLSSSMTDNDIVNQFFYGLFAQNGLPQPQYCLKCIDDVTASKLVKFANTILPQLAKLLPPVEKLKAQVTDFANTLDRAALACLGFSYEIQFLGEKFGIEAGSSAEDIAKEAEDYYIKHELKTHNFFKEMNKLNNEKKYFEGGFQGSIFFHDIVDGKNLYRKLGEITGHLIHRLRHN